MCFMRSWLNVPILNYFYTNGYSMRNEQEELEALAQPQRCDITGTSESWWDGLCGWSALLEGSRLLWGAGKKGEAGEWHSM